ncbi:MULTISPECIES: DsbA family oxidoreductase [Acinetobacter]|jgi:predicted DsbA family dithiol-disulfide isomerase|uniref:DSBA-like thioredoxin domain protein n=1 Tax=Acinetobacter venetianus TaxID=52133 RepID=A0A137XNW8_9GAMM|nr:MULTISPECIES: DsbA family oxidoreductase [Acinetobacter]MDA0696361.1 DsbA family oxidoreductase [Pseudomonadota bacterium]ERS02121.1 dithiol-disulfide isomerase [Acinetobacter sp. COS3]KXO75396.1 dithiol-disulfide isomerase [Acinetobacter venetianus]KXO86760.1 dithiol-disulfide isomerase [Acinetobacter venetianus]KXZ64292.1 DSBA-like thioredoxin domain protein [Acinetobacter venetianus]
MRVDIWSDVVCPFCYIGKKRLEHVAEEAGIELEIHWHSFELDPNAPAKHDTSNTERLAKKYGRSYAEMEEMERNVAAMAASEGIDFQWQKANSGNSFNAHRIIHLAQSKGLGNEAKEAFFHAYMTEGLAIGEREVVEEIASRIGLDNAEVEYVLDSDELADFVRHDEKIAHEQLKVTGVPFFVFDQKLALSGAQPREVFLQALQQADSDDQNIEQTDAAQCNDDSCEIKP